MKPKRVVGVWCLEGAIHAEAATWGQEVKHSYQALTSAMVDVFMHTSGMSEALKAGILYKMFLSWAQVKARLRDWERVENGSKTAGMK